MRKELQRVTEFHSMKVVFHQEKNIAECDSHFLQAVVVAAAIVVAFFVLLHPFLLQPFWLAPFLPVAACSVVFVLFLHADVAKAIDGF